MCQQLLPKKANAIFILLQSIEAGVFENEVATEIYIWSSKQINYMLGANGMHYSYLIGYGNEYVKNPYHKNSACSKSKECGWSFYESLSDNQNTLIGALVGGPDVNDYHKDTRQNKLGNSVALEYNAGFQSALAGLEKKNLQLEK
ncbi:endoglucanase E-4-like, partial [Ruditapes philippinarum]|uniref:endoglucanase E-4-like n=1 Tax=Ruditapes philippinarum TaxID=129788 RepID=UPI00295B4DEC